MLKSALSKGLFADKIAAILCSPFFEVFPDNLAMIVQASIGQKHFLGDRQSSPLSVL